MLTNELNAGTDTAVQAAKVSRGCHESGRLRPLPTGWQVRCTSQASAIRNAIRMSILRLSMVMTT